MEPLNILFLSRNGSVATEALKEYEKERILLREVRTTAEAQREVMHGQYEAVIYRTTRASEIDPAFLRFLKTTYPAVPVILMVKEGAVEDVVRLMKAGADDFVVAPEIGAGLVDVVFRNTRKTRRKEALASQDTDQAGQGETLLVGKSPAIEEVRSAIDLVAKSQTAVLITGESGTGKEVAARLIHQRSDRSRKPFLAINCAALPRDVIESELFGHEKGAFTGAIEKRSGCFELANTGTLFFDEIAEMNPDTQAKLLRAIEEKAFRRVGGREEIKVDVRLIAATNKNVEQALSTGEFRQDLYYRFSVIEITLPPLRERREDIPLLADHFLRLFRERYKRGDQRFSNEALQFLQQYHWPGNVRELRNAIERIVVTSPDAVILPDHLTDRLMKSEAPVNVVNIPIGTSAEEAERQLILKTLSFVRNNKSKAARMLGVSRKTLHNKLRSFSRREPAPVI